IWGNGEERKQRLEEVGYDYDAIQEIVNEKLS
ncbi:MAG: lysozyme, partial [Granulicatella sp.]|nr:lysozyme [Granulicatella sp.]